MAKERFVISFKLDTSSIDENILTKRFEIARHIYNSVLNIALKRYNELIKTKAWRENQANISAIYSAYSNKDKRLQLCKPYFDIKRALLKEYKLSEYELHKLVSPMQKHFKDNIDSHVAQKIASRVWKSFDDLIYGNGKSVNFKSKYMGLDSVEGKNNIAGLKYKEADNMLLWLSLKIKPMIDFNNQYEIDALRAKICFVRITRKFIRGKYKYYMQLVLEGVPPTKVNKNTGEIKNSLGVGTLGIDIGTQTIAYVSDYSAKLLELAPRVADIEKQKRKLLRYMDRSKRATNPDNFNVDGTVKRGIKLKWNYSNNYKKAKNELMELYRKQKDIRRLQHNILANKIISEADTVYIETMSFKALQRRAKKTTINSKTGRINKKKRFGKSLANKAPAMLIEMIENKLKAKGGKLYKVNTWSIKASQYNHLNNSYNKKNLSQRWNYLSQNGKEIKVQRDLYSAYLIKNVTSDLDKIDNDKCNKSFDKFLKLHEEEIKRLSNYDNLSSMGIKKAV